MQRYWVESSGESRRVQGRRITGIKKSRPTAGGIGLLLVMLLYLGTHAAVDKLGPGHAGGTADGQSLAQRQALLPHPSFAAREAQAYALRTSPQPTRADAAGS